MGKKESETERLVFLSQTTARDFIVYPEHAYPVIEWLEANSHRVVTWEAFLRGKRETVRTQAYGDPRELVDGRFRCQDAEHLKESINAATEKWSAEGIDEKLVICLNLERDLQRPQKMISTLTRVAAGMFGGLSLALAIALIVFIFVDEDARIQFLWRILAPLLICGPIFLYAAITGRGELPFMGDPFAIGKAMNRRKFITETGAKRW